MLPRALGCAYSDGFLQHRELVILARTKNGGIIPAGLTGRRIEISGGDEAAAPGLAQVRSMNKCLGDEVAGNEVDDTDVVGVDHTLGSCDYALPSQGDDIGITWISRLGQSRKVVGGGELAGQDAVSAQSHR